MTIPPPRERLPIILFHHMQWSSTSPAQPAVIPQRMVPPSASDEVSRNPEPPPPCRAGLGFVLPCLLWIALFSLAPHLTPQAATAPVKPVRHVVIVENSTSMREQREQAADLLSRLFLDGFRGRAQLGDVIELWVLDQNIQTNALPAFRWHPIASMDNSTSTYRYLRSLKPSNATVSFRNTLSLLDLENPKIPQLLVYIVCSGSNLIEGTPFDDKINPILAGHRDKLTKDGLPFVVVLAAENGKWIGHGVTPGDRNPYIPPFPPPPAPAPTPKPAATTKTNTPAPLIGVIPPDPPAQPKPLSVAEIQAEMKRADMERALTNRQNAAVQSPQNPPAAPQTTQTNTPPPQPAQTNAPSPATNSTPQVETTNTPTTLPPQETNAPPAAITPPPANPTPEPPPAPKTTNIHPASATPQQPPAHTSPTSPWKHLSLGLLYLTAAGALVVVLVRQNKRHKHPSVITESLNRPTPTNRRNP